MDLKQQIERTTRKITIGGTEIATDQSLDQWLRRKANLGRYLTLSDPRNGEEVSQVALGTTEEVTFAIENSRKAQPAWGALSHLERSRVLHKLAKLIRENAEELSELEISETGKLKANADVEVEDSADYFEYYAGLVRAFFGETIGLGETQHVYTRHEPFGVIGMITPWNSPILQAARGVAPALAVGNAVVLKPSEFTSSTAVALAKLASEGGLAPGLFNVVNGDGPSVGSPLVMHDHVSKVCFTGSVQTGRTIAKICADRLIPCTLELGGKSPNVVFADAPLDDAAAGIVGFSRNAGQVCSALTRLIVERSVHDLIVEKVVARIGAMAPGKQIAPLTTEAQFAKVKDYFAVCKKRRRNGSDRWQ